MPRQGDKSPPPGQQPVPPRQHLRRQCLHLAARQRIKRLQGGYEAGREDLGEGPEWSVWDGETARAGRYDLGQGAANLPRPRAAKVEMWWIPELPVHTVVRIQTTPLEIQGTAKHLCPLRAPTGDIFTPNAWGPRRKPSERSC